MKEALTGQADYWEWDCLSSYKETVPGDSWKASWRRWFWKGVSDDDVLLSSK